MKIGCLCLFAIPLGLLCALNISAQTSSRTQKSEIIVNTGCGYSGENFAILTNYLKNTDGTKGYIIIYEGKLAGKNYKDGILTGSEYFLPTRDAAQKFRNKIKEILSASAIKSDRIVFIKGGGRDYFSVDFWLVPNGTKPPKATPPVKKIEYRKGQSPGFCS